MTTPPPALRVVVAINPPASFGRGRPVGPSVVTALRRAGHEVVPLQESSHADLWMASVAALATSPSPDDHECVGGDGMVSLGVNLVAGTSTPLGIVPSGTGNDFARALGIPHDDPAEATRMLVAGLAHPARAVDAIRVHRGPDDAFWVAGSVSAGFDAFVNERANRMRRPKGRMRYDVALVLELLRLRQVHYTLVLDGAEHVVTGPIITVGNARTIGGGIALLPDAVVDDGLLDVFVVDRMPRIPFVRLLAKCRAGADTSTIPGSTRIASRRSRSRRPGWSLMATASVSASCPSTSRSLRVRCT
jgi:diacylglycerol kinase (ATP)